jgi:hypothetical protein
MRIPLVLALGVVLIFIAAAGCSKQEKTAVSKPESAASGNPLTAPVDYLGAVAKAKQVSEKVVDSTSLNQAIQLFYAQEDRFPRDLNELVAKQYIARIPAAPAGTRWAYNPRTGEIKAAPQP